MEILLLELESFLSISTMELSWFKKMLMLQSWYIMLILKKQSWFLNKTKQKKIMKWEIMLKWLFLKVNLMMIIKKQCTEKFSIKIQTKTNFMEAKMTVKIKVMNKRIQRITTNKMFSTNRMPLDLMFLIIRDNLDHKNLLLLDYLDKIIIKFLSQQYKRK